MPDKDSAFQKKIKKKLLDRSWYQVSDAWLSTLPSTNTKPESDFMLLEGFDPLRQVLAGLPDGTDEICTEVPGVREILFEESLFLFHKAINVLSVAETNATKGTPTWSLSTAYHAAFFGVRSLTRLLGVGHVSYRGNIWIIDIFPQKEKLSRRGKSSVISAPEMLIFKSPAQIEQRHVWHLFQRLATITKFDDTLLREMATDLWKMDSGSFTLQRHSLLYSNNSWSFDDLYKPLTIAGFGERTAPFSVREELSEVDFTMILGYSIVEFGRRSLFSMKTKTNILDDVLAIIDASIGNDRHPIYNPSRSVCFL